MEHAARGVGVVYRSDRPDATPGKPPDAKITIFTSGDEPLCKRFSVANGEINKETLATLYKGTAKVAYAPNAATLNALLDGLQHRQAIATGMPRGHDVVRIVTEAQRASDGAITRSLQHFAYPRGSGWLLWDYDDKTMPPMVRERIEALGGPVAAFFHIWPEAQAAAHVIRPSSSDGISAPGLPALNSSGLHGFFLVQDVSQSRAILEALERRAWAEGLAWIALSKSGAKLRRSIVDTAVGSPERLIFEAPPILLGEVTRKPRAPIVSEGYALSRPDDGPTLFSIAEKAESNAREAIEPAAKEKQSGFIDDQAQQIATQTGKSILEARETVRQMMQGAVLSDDHLLQMKSGAWMRVGDLLDDPHKYDRLSLPDPIEGLDYGSDKATLLLKPRPGHPDDRPRLVSHAHGVRTIYTFARYMSPAELEAAERGGARVDLPPAADLPDGKEKTIQTALQGADDQTALPLAVAAAHKLQNRVPHRLGVDQVTNFIKGNLPNELLHPAQLNAVAARVEWLVAKRRSAVMARTRFHPKAHEKHDVQRIDDLRHQEIGLTDGVTIVTAPPGAGKTQRVGRPFIEAARARGWTAMAICHRITLTAELARRLRLPDYRTATAEECREGVATCLPSILRPDIAEALPCPEVVFIDEVAQVLQFLSDGKCSSSGGDAQAIFERLKQIVQAARAVLVADANVDQRTIDFLERCRPGQRFRIIEVPPTSRDKTAEVFGAADPVIDRVAVELAAGGKVWLACEGAEKAEALASMFRREGYRVMCVTARTKLEGAAAAFLDNAETASRDYDLVVSSPAISSGLSIEHVDGEHFTLGGFIGAGSAIRPEDAMQQLGRVRYLRRFVIGMEFSNLSGGISADAIRAGIEGAAELEELQTRWTSFDTFRADVKAEAHNAKADFAAGLWWLLERDGWCLVRGEGGGSNLARNARDAHRDTRAAELLAAEPLTPHQASLLRCMERTLEQETRLEAHLIRLEFGKMELTTEDIDLWDAGRARAVRERFEDLTGEDAWREEGIKTLTDRKFREARRKLYAELLDGIDWRSPIPMAVCEVILDRLMARPETYAAVGIVGPKYQARKAGRNGVLAPVKRPKQAGREVTEILRRAGVSVTRRVVSNRLKTACPSILRESVLSQEPARSDGRDYALAATCESVAVMQEWLARRKIFDLEAEMHGRASEQPYEALLEARAIKRDLREERAAIAEYDGGLSREDAERMADGLPPRFQPLNPVVADYLRRVAEVEDWPKVRKARDGTTGT